MSQDTNWRVVDTAFVAKVVSGDRLAQAQLIQQRAGRFIPFLVWRLEMSATDAEEVPNRLFLHLRENDWRRLRLWRAECPLDLWLKEVTWNLCVRVAKRERAEANSKTSIEAVQDWLAEGNPGWSIESGALWQHTLEELANTENVQHRLVNTLELQCVDRVEIAARTGFGRDNVDTIIRRFRSGLKKRMGLL